jgi:hypothetical protein
MNEKPEGVVKRRRGRAEVEQLVMEFARSGLKAKEFCADRGLSLSTLHRYLKKRRQKRGAVKSEGRLVAVELVGRSLRTESGWGWAVVLRSGRKLEVPDDFDESRLERLVCVLERI